MERKIINMEYDKTFVCPKCKQDYTLSQFRPIITTNFQNDQPEIYYEAIFSCINNYCPLKCEQRKTLSAVEIKNLLYEGYDKIADYWGKVGEKECEKSVREIQTTFIESVIDKSKEIVLFKEDFNKISQELTEQIFYDERGLCNNVAAFANLWEELDRSDNDEIRKAIRSVIKNYLEEKIIIKTERK